MVEKLDGNVSRHGGLEARGVMEYRRVGVMECWSVGVLRHIRFASLVGRGSGMAARRLQSD
jgi:hypothetical protein